MSAPYEILRPQTCPSEYADSVASERLKQLKDKWQSILLIGPAGTGKTTQLWALQRKLVKNHDYSYGQHKVHIISECGDIDRRRYEWDWLEAWAQFPGVLCVDDVGYRKPQEWTTQAVYHIATSRRANNLRVIWTTNLDAERLADIYGAPIASRLSGGEVISAGGADRRLKKTP